MRNFALPNFSCTEEALRFGATVTRDQYVFVAGGLAAMRAEFDELRDIAGSCQLQADLATKMSLLRECLEAAPERVVCSLLDSTIAEFIR